MIKKETKLFVAGTDDEVQPGDVVEVVLVKESKGKKLHKREYCNVTEETLPYLIEIGVIEKKETPVEDKNLIDFDENDEDDCPFSEIIENLTACQDILDEKVDVLEERITELEDIVSKLIANKKHK